jgi:plasmid stabilization system protein ParE
MIGYRFLPPAEDEMSEAASFYDAASVGLGEDFLLDIQQRVNRLREYPMAGTPVAPKLRRMLLLHFPFSIIYAEEPDAILIVSIAHHRRRPDYWKLRIGQYF